MSLSKFAVGLLLFLSFWSQTSLAAERCGPTVQTFWTIKTSRDPVLSAKKAGIKKAFGEAKIFAVENFFHKNEQFCTPSDSAAYNAKVILRNKQHKIEIIQPIYVSLAEYFEGFENNKIKKENNKPMPTSLQLQIKFVHSRSFDSAKYIEIVFKDGSKIGPSPIL